MSHDQTQPGSFSQERKDPGNKITEWIAEGGPNFLSLLKEVHTQYAMNGTKNSIEFMLVFILTRFNCREYIYQGCHGQ